MANKIIKTVLISALLAGSFFFISRMASSPTYQDQKMEVSSMERPDSIPEAAVFRGGADGGYFVTLSFNPLFLSNGRSLTAYDMGIYHSFSGEPEYVGRGIYIPPREVLPDMTERFIDAPAVNVILGTAYYRFGALEFPVQGASSPGRIIPLPLE